MQPRLVRSQSDVIVAGVCGGLAEYFHIDPVIVRLVFVLVTITSGFGLIVYPVLWIVMPQPPRQPLPPETPLDPAQASIPAEQQWQPQAVRLREPAPHMAPRPGAPTYADQPPPPEEYRFDPLTGQPISRDQGATGATTDLSRHPAARAAQEAQAPQPDPKPRKRAKVSWVGIVLVGFGVMMLAEQIGIDPDIMFPVLMVAFGALLLFRR